MKKNQSIIISTTLVVLGIFLFLQTEKKVVLKNNIVRMPWGEIRKDKLVEIEITAFRNQEPLSYNIRREQGIWQITKPVSIQAKQDRAITLANDFLSIRPTSQLTNITEEEKESYGLNTPRIKIAGILKDDTTNYILIGNKTSIGNQYYVSENTLGNVYLIDNTELEPFIQGMPYLIDNLFITKNIENIMGLEIKNSLGETFIFTNENCAWKQISPSTSSPVDWGIKQFLLNLKNLSFVADSVRFSPTSETLENLKIDMKNSPKLILYYNDSKSEFYISTTVSENGYPIHSINQQLVAYSPKGIIEEIFNVRESDFTVER